MNFGKNIDFGVTGGVCEQFLKDLCTKVIYKIRNRIIWNVLDRVHQACSPVTNI